MPLEVLNLASGVLKLSFLPNGPASRMIESRFFGSPAAIEVTVYAANPAVPFVRLPNVHSPEVRQVPLPHAAFAAEADCPSLSAPTDLFGTISLLPSLGVAACAPAGSRSAASTVAAAAILRMLIWICSPWFVLLVELARADS